MADDWQYGDDGVEDGKLLLEVTDSLILDGKLSMGDIDWRHTRSLSFREWHKRASRSKPDRAKTLKGETCVECKQTIPIIVLAVKDGHVIDSWGGILYSRKQVVCDDCSPI